MRLVFAAVMAAVLVHAPVLAQAPPTDGKTTITPASPMSLQSQLGSIPLVSPRAAARTAMLRTVRLTQMEGRSTRGAIHEVACPDTGCQIAVSLMVDNVAQAFLADVQFVSQGAYVSLQPRTAAIGGVMEFRQGRPGPVFLKGNATTTIEQRISFVTAPATSLRRLETAADGNTLTSGNLYTRKRTADMVLRVEIDAARER
jgi:hypothetical protein